MHFDLLHVVNDEYDVIHKIYQSASASGFSFGPQLIRSCITRTYSMDIIEWYFGDDSNNFMLKC